MSIAAGGKVSRVKSGRSRQEALLHDATEKVISAANANQTAFLEIERKKVLALEKLSEDKKVEKKELNVIKEGDDFGIPIRYSDIPNLQTQLQHFVEEDEVSGVILSIDGIRTELVYDDQLREDVKCHQFTVSVFIGKKSDNKYILLTK